MGDDPLIDPNTASADALALVPGISPVLAGAIVATRRRLPFADLDDLVRVPGVRRSQVRKWARWTFPSTTIRAVSLMLRLLPRS